MIDSRSLSEKMHRIEAARPDLAPALRSIAESLAALSHDDPVPHVIRTWGRAYAHVAELEDLVERQTFPGR